MLATLKELWTDLLEEYGTVVGAIIFTVCLCFLVLVLLVVTAAYYSIRLVDWLTTDPKNLKAR